MKTVWKWVIGIVVVLVVLALLVGGAFLLRSRMMNVASVTRVIRPGTQLPGNRQLPVPNTGNNNGTSGNGVRRYPGMVPFGNGRGMYMGGFGMLGFGRMMPFGGFFGGLVSLGLLVLIVLAIIWLVRNLRQPVVMAAAPVAAVNPVAPVVNSHPCQKCGLPVQAGWQFCPHCGEKQ
jgi:zinc-ribbon domain